MKFWKGVHLNTRNQQLGIRASWIYIWICIVEVTGHQTEANHQEPLQDYRNQYRYVAPLCRQQQI